jgi:hypothetical protein
MGDERWGSHEDTKARRSEQSESECCGVVRFNDRENGGDERLAMSDGRTVL